MQNSQSMKERFKATKEHQKKRRAGYSARNALRFRDFYEQAIEQIKTGTYNKIYVCPENMTLSTTQNRLSDGLKFIVDNPGLIESKYPEEDWVRLKAFVRFRLTDQGIEISFTNKFEGNSKVVSHDRTWRAEFLNWLGTDSQIFHKASIYLDEEDLAWLQTQVDKLELEFKYAEKGLTVVKD